MHQGYYLLCAVIFLHHLSVNSLKDTELTLSYNLTSPSDSRSLNSPPIILLHGLLDSKKTWKYVAQPLSEKTGRQVYALDHRNHGESPWTEDFSMDIMVDDVDNFLNKQNISKAILLGHSMGGRIAQALTLRQPQKVEKLIVEEMSTANLADVPSAGVGFLMRLLRKSLTAIPPGADEQTAIDALRAFFFKKIPANFVPRKTMAVDIAPVNIDGGNITWQANLDVLEERIYSGALGINMTGTYEGDALFIYGTKSFLAIDKDNHIKDYFPRAEMLAFEGGTHLIHQAYPEDYVREIVRFIKGSIKPYSNCE